MRLFVGLAISEAVKELLERLTLRLRANDDGLRWSTSEQWHVTLVFLGEIGEKVREDVVRNLTHVRQPVLTLRITELGVFERSGILYAGVEITEELLKLYEATAAAVRRCGVEVEERPYRAHVTLARARNREGRKTIERLRKIVGPKDQQRLRAMWSVEEFLLYESQLSPGGSRYAVRERFALGEATR